MIAKNIQDDPAGIIFHHFITGLLTHSDGCKTAASKKSHAAAAAGILLFHRVDFLLLCLLGRVPAL